MCWSPTGESLAVGLTTSEIEVFSQLSLERTRTIESPDCCNGDAFAGENEEREREDAGVVTVVVVS